MAKSTDGAKVSLRNIAANCFLGIKDNASYAGAEAALTAASAEFTPEWIFKSEQDAYYMINALAPTVCLNVAYERTTVGGSLQQWDCNGGASELWTLVPASESNFLLVNKNSGLAAGVADFTNGSSIVQVETSSPLARWEVISRDSAINSSKPLVVPEGEESTQALHAIFIDAPTLPDEMIYNIYVPIYSSTGTLDKVSQDLPRIARLGFSTVLLMPIHPIGIPTGRHPAVGSPYAVANFYSVDPALGELSDFAALVNRAHNIGLKIVMDVVLNHTAWNHPFITQRPDYYVHTDYRKDNPHSIAQAFWFEDVAQLDYKSGSAVQGYMSATLVWWMKNFHVDGFRFDTVDNPYGKNRMIPASVWSFIGEALKAVNPKAILLGECTNPDLSLKPFNMDYTNYSLQPAIVAAIKSQNATKLSKVFNELKTKHPRGMLHTSVMQTWDMDLDLRMYGGPDRTLVAAVFNFTIEGVPMLFAGEEVGNDRGGVNTHTQINWNSPLANRFNAFYMSLGALRRRNLALRRGSTTWLKVSGGGAGLITFIRTYQNIQVFIAINFSASPAEGKSHHMKDGKWTEVTPPSAAYPTAHAMPPHIKLGPWDFALFTRVDSNNH